MSGFISSKKNPLVVENTFPDTDLRNAQFIIKAAKTTQIMNANGDWRIVAAPNLSVFTGSINVNTHETFNAGGGKYVAVKRFAAGGTRGASAAWLGNSISLINLSVSGAVYGGAIVSTTKGYSSGTPSGKYITDAAHNTITATINGNSSVELVSGKYSSVYGGGAGYGSIVTGNSTVDYVGGRVSTIYGGGATGAVVAGDAQVNVIGSSNGTNKIGKIYAGGKNAAVTGDVGVTFSAKAALVSFTGTVYGRGYGSKSTVGGESNLTFDAYAGDFKATINSFDNVVFTAGTSVTFTKSFSSTMKGAEWTFEIGETSLNKQGAILTWNKKASLNSIDIVIDSETLQTNGGKVTLIAGKYLSSFDTAAVDVYITVDGVVQRAGAYSYNINFAYDKKTGGVVTLNYKGGSMMLDMESEEKVTLSGGSDEANLVAGGVLQAGLDTGAGNDTVNVQKGAEIHGVIQLGTGDDRMVVNKDAEVDADVELGSGTNTLVVQTNGQITGSVIFSADSDNTVNVNGGAILAFEGGDETTDNTIILNGNADGGGVGYWTTWQGATTTTTTGTNNNIDVDLTVDGKPISGTVNGTVGTNGTTTTTTTDTSARYWVSQNLNLGASNDTVVINDGARAGSVYLGAGNDKLVLNDTTGIGNSIGFGSGTDVLVLNTDLQNAQTVRFTDGGDVIVANVNGLTINAAQLHMGGTGNVLAVANGMTVNLTGASFGNLITSENDANAIWRGVYFGQNAVAVMNGADIAIQNYSGLLNTNASLVILAADDAVPELVADYVLAQTDGVEASTINAAANVTVMDGAKLTDSTVNLTGAAFRVEDGVTLDGVEINLNGALTQSVVFEGVPAAVSGVIRSNGSGDSVVFHNDFDNANLVIEATVADVRLILNDDILVTIGEAKKTGLFADNFDFTYTFGANAMLLEKGSDTLTVGASDKALDFTGLAANVRVLATLNGDVTFTDQNIMLVDAGDFARMINLSGANTLSIGLDTWFDAQQFAFAAGSTLLIDILSGNTFAIDGVIPEGFFDAVSFKLNANSVAGIGDTAMIQDWLNGSFDLGNVNLPTGLVNHTFDNLIVQGNAKITGAVIGTDGANEITIQDGVVINGDNYLYDFGSVELRGGDDTLNVGNATINGAITAGDGNDTVTLDNTVVTAAVNQAIPAINLGAGDDVLNLHGAVITGDVAVGAGNDTVVLTNGAKIVDELALDGGVNTVELQESTVGAVVLGNAANTVNVYGAATVGSISSDAAGAEAQINVVKGTIASNVQPYPVVVANGALTVADGKIELNAATNGIALDGGASLTLADTIGAASNFIALAGADNSIAIEGDSTLGGLRKLTMGYAPNANGEPVVVGTNNVLHVNQSTLDVAGNVHMGANGLNTISDINWIAETVPGNPGLTTGSKITTDTVGGTLNIAGDLNMAAQSNVLAIFGETTVGGDLNMAGVDANPGFNFIANTDPFVTASADAALGSGTVKVAGNVAMGKPAGPAGAPTVAAAQANIVSIDTFEATGSVEMAGQINNIESDSFKAGSVEMSGSRNIIDSENFEAGSVAMSGVVSNAIVGVETVLKNNWTAADAGKTFEATINLDRTFDAAGGIAMNAAANTVGAGLDVTLDGTYDNTGARPLHNKTTAVIGSASSEITGDITMAGAAASNNVAVGISLTADGEASIALNAAASATIDGDVEMTGARNTVFAGVNLNAGRESWINLHNHTITAGIGDISMNATTANTLSVGYSYSTAPAISDAEPSTAGRILNRGAISTTAGDIVMNAANGTNALNIGKFATVGTILMAGAGKDAVASSNTLNLDAEGFVGSTIVMEGMLNTATLGVRDLAALAVYNVNSLSMGGETNLVTVGEGVNLGVLTIGGVVDADQFGNEGYIWVLNTLNVINVQGVIGQIVSGAGASAQVTNYIGLDGVNDGQTMTGNSHLLIGGQWSYNALLGTVVVDAAYQVKQDSVINGDVSLTQGNEQSVVVQANAVTDTDLDAAKQLGFTSTVTGNVELEAANTNALSLDGAYTLELDANGNPVTGPEKPLAAYRASIGGAVTMTAADDDVADGIAANSVAMREASTITGKLTMAAGGYDATGVYSNRLNVNACDVLTYGGANPRTVDLTDKVGGVEMQGLVNQIDISGTLQSTAAISMVQTAMTRAAAQTKSNTITVNNDGRLVVDAGIGMGAVVDATGAYAYDATLIVDLIENHGFVFNDNGKVYTTTNTLTVNGKADVAGAIGMVGLANTITLSGLDTAVAGAGIFGMADYGLRTPHLAIGGAVAMQGYVNSINVEARNVVVDANSSADALLDATIARYSSLGITQTVEADALQDSIIRGNGDAAWNALILNGLEVREAAGDNTTRTVVFSTVNGDVIQTNNLALETGDGTQINTAALNITNVTGNIQQNAINSNTLSIAGSFKAQYLDPAGELADSWQGQAYQSQIGGNIVMVAQGYTDAVTDGSNLLVVSDAAIAGSVGLVSVTGNNVTINGRGFERITGADWMISPVATFSTVGTGITADSSNGNNRIELNLTDVNANGISMTAAGNDDPVATVNNNTLNITGWALPGAVIPRPLLGDVVDPVAVRQAQVSGAISLEADGANVAILTTVHVDDITMTTVTAGNFAGSSNNQLAMIGGASFAAIPGSKPWLGNAVERSVTQSVAGAITQTTANGSNAVALQDVAAGAVAMTANSIAQGVLPGQGPAAYNNTFFSAVSGNAQSSSTGSQAYAGVVANLVQTGDAWYRTGNAAPVIQQTAAVQNTIASLTMTAANGANDETTFAETNVTGDIVMSSTRIQPDATDFWTAIAVANSFNSLTMTSAFNRPIAVTDAAGVPLFSDATAAATPFVLDANGGVEVGGSITQTADGANTINLTNVAVAGAVSQESTDTGDNRLTMTGTQWDELREPTGLQRVAYAAGQFGSSGAITQTAITGDNTATLTDVVTGAVSQTAITGNNTAVLIGSDTGAITQSATAGNNTATLTDSVSGAIEQTATTGANSLTLNTSTSGAITALSSDGNTVRVLGALIPADNVAHKSASIDPSRVNGAIDLTSTAAGDNLVNITNGVTGSLTIETGTGVAALFADEAGFRPGDLVADTEVGIYGSTTPAWVLKPGKTGADAADWVNQINVITPAIVGDIELTTFNGSADVEINRAEVGNITMISNGANPFATGSSLGDSYNQLALTDANVGAISQTGNGNDGTSTNGIVANLTASADAATPMDADGKVWIINGVETSSIASIAQNSTGIGNVVELNGYNVAGAITQTATVAAPAVVAPGVPAAANNSVVIAGGSVGRLKYTDVTQTATEADAPDTYGSVGAISQNTNNGFNSIIVGSGVVASITATATSQSYDVGDVATPAVASYNRIQLTNTNVGAINMTADFNGFAGLGNSLTITNVGAADYTVGEIIAYRTVNSSVTVNSGATSTTVASITTGAGADSITLNLTSAAGTVAVANGITTEAGDDVITFMGTVANLTVGTIDMGVGSDTLNLAADMTLGTVRAEEALAINATAPGTELTFASLVGNANVTFANVTIATVASLDADELTIGGTLTLTGAADVSRVTANEIEFSTALEVNGWNLVDTATFDFVNATASITGYTGDSTAFEGLGNARFVTGATALSNWINGPDAAGNNVKGWASGTTGAVTLAVLNETTDTITLKNVTLA